MPARKHFKSAAFVPDDSDDELLPSIELLDSAMDTTEDETTSTGSMSTQTTI